MKKLICVLLIIISMFSVAFADGMDLSLYTFNELMELRDQCQLMMMQRDELKEVTIPQGVYIVGIDIPSGIWTIKCKIGSACDLQFGDELAANGQDIKVKASGRYARTTVYNENDKHYINGLRMQWIVELVDGDYFVISGYPATFIPGAISKPYLFE